MSKRKTITCLACGNETLQGTLCAVCKVGLPRIRQELIDLLKEDDNVELLKKLKTQKRRQNTSLN